MATAEIEARFAEVVACVDEALKPFGFAKRRNTFRRLSDGNSALVEFQRSQSSNHEAIRFTLNLGVVCGRLLEDWGAKLSNAGSADAHLRQRLGAYLSEPHDKWWTIDSATDPSGVATEIIDLLGTAVPFLLSHLTEAQLLALWRSGQSPGLTQKQSARFVAELESART